MIDETHEIACRGLSVILMADRANDKSTRTIAWHGMCYRWFIARNFHCFFKRIVNVLAIRLDSGRQFCPFPFQFPPIFHGFKVFSHFPRLYCYSLFASIFLSSSVHLASLAPRLFPVPIFLFECFLSPTIFISEKNSNDAIENRKNRRICRKRREKPFHLRIKPRDRNNSREESRKKIFENYLRRN